MNTVEQYAEEKQRVVDAVLAEIKVDLANGANQSVKGLLMLLSVDKLKGYLPEECEVKSNYHC